MHTFIVLFIFLTFCVALSSGLHKVWSVAKYIADIHQELPISCVFIMKSDGEQQGDKNYDFFLHEYCVFWKKMYSDFESLNDANLIENTFLEKIGYR